MKGFRSFFGFLGKLIFWWFLMFLNLEDDGSLKDLLKGFALLIIGALFIIPMSLYIEFFDLKNSVYFGLAYLITGGIVELFARYFLKKSILE